MNSYCPVWAARSGSQLSSFLCALALIVGLSVPTAQAAPKASQVTVVPTINNITLGPDGLVASGSVSGSVKGQPFTSSFTNVPVDINLAEDQTAAGACPILDLSLAPINLDVLGLVVETSPICLEITAYEGGGLLGDLLCGVAGLLDGGLSLNDILGGLNLVDPTTGVELLPGLTQGQVGELLGGIQNLLNTTLGQLLGAVLNDILDGSGTTCSVLHLELGPLTLNLLGLEVNLDDCADGPVVVDITAERGNGKLLGNLLCGLLNGGQLSLGNTLQDLLDGLLRRLP